MQAISFYFFSCLLLFGVATNPLHSWGSQELFSKFPNTYFVETGSFCGDGIQQAFDAGFSQIYSMELSEFYYQHCQDRFASRPNIHIVKGDSSKDLGTILSQIDAPATFWLDGHNSSGKTAMGGTNCPLLAELKAISEHPIKTHTLLIDDLRLCGTIEFDFIELQEIIDIVLKINPSYQIHFENGFVPNDILVAKIPDSTPQPTASEPSKGIPPGLYDAFTMNRVIDVVYSYRNDSYPSYLPAFYSMQQVEDCIKMAQERQCGYYGATDSYLYSALDRYLPQIQGKHVAIIGSTTPWYESMLLSYGAIPTVIEYNTICCEDPRIEYITVDELERYPRTFDAIISISSYEHDGLGRYGDPINPYADFQAMEKAKKLLRPGGLLFLAVPIGKDTLVWNLHRIYGKHRLKALLQGWRILEYFGFCSEDLDRGGQYAGHQPIFVLTPKTLF